MQLHFVTKPKKDSVLIYPIFHQQNLADKKLNHILIKLIRGKEFSPKCGHVFYLYGAGLKNLPGKIIFVGLGKSKKLTVSSTMEAFGNAVKHTLSHESKTVSVVVPEALYTFAQAIAEALVLGSYQAEIPYKTGKALAKLQRRKIDSLEIIVKKGAETFRKDFEKGVAIATVVNEVRDMVNAPPNIAHGDFFENMARGIARETGAKLTILKRKQLQKLGMGAFLGVNRGSQDEARLIIMDYQPRKVDKKEPPLVLVGKGIIFDSGGYNLKPRGFIEDMQLDKAGASAVLALVKLLPTLGIKKRVVAIAPFTENLIGSQALKPSEILKTYSGKTVEITNTDGEGRLILCDAISYAIDVFKPRFLIDVATLTGACMVALGDRYAGLFGNDKELQDTLRAAGEEVDELLWPMPIHKDDAGKMKGRYADLRNADIGSEMRAGASKGAAFLQEFVGKTKWAHLDIASPAFTQDPKKYESKGATGFGVRLLLKFLEKLI